MLLVGGWVGHARACPVCVCSLISCYRVSASACVCVWSDVTVSVPQRVCLCVSVCVV